MNKYDDTTEDYTGVSTFKLVFWRNLKFFCWFIVILISVLITAGIIIWHFWSKHNTNDLLWTNYWVMVAAIIPIAGAVISFFFNIQINEYVKNKEIFRAIQDQVRNQQISKIINFSKNRDNITENQKFNLVKDLASMIYTSIDNDKKRASLKLYSDDPNIGDLGSFNDKLYEIIQDEKNEDIVKEVQKNYPDLDKFISDNQLTIKHEVTVDRSTTLDTDTSIMTSDDKKILGYWILNQFSAKNAKYLVGVSTQDKRILGVYRLNNEIDVDESTKRILFHASKRLYFDNAIEKSIIMPNLDQWSAQNPVLYYKQYLQSKNIKLGDEDVRELNHIISPETYESLNPRDIIVVRTFKFDMK